MRVFVTIKKIRKAKTKFFFSGVMNWATPLLSR